MSLCRRESGAPAGANRDALILGPRPDTAAALAACRGPRGSAVLFFAGSAGMLDEGRELAAERGGVLSAQIDLVVGAANSEPDRLIRRPSVKIVFQHDGYLLCHLRLPGCDRLPARYKINCRGAAAATPLAAPSYFAASKNRYEGAVSLGLSTL